MAPDSLLDQSRRSIARNIRSLTSIGSLRPELIAPLLLKIENPSQLHTLELNSPSILPHTRDAWLSLLRKNIPNLTSRLPPDYETTLFAPENAARWHLIYRKLRKQVDKETASLDKKLAAQLASINEKPPAAVVDRPRNQLQVGKNKFVNAQAAYTTNLYKTGKAGGPSFFERVRASDAVRKRARVTTPSHMLKPRMVNGVTKAPVGLVAELREKKALALENQLKGEEQRRRRQEGGSGATQGVRPPTALGATSYRDREAERSGPQKAKPPLHGGNYDLTKDREERLRALKAGKAAPKPAPSVQEIAKLTAGFLEGDDEYDEKDDYRADYNSNNNNGDDDDLFDEKPKTKVRPSPAKIQHSTASPKPAVRMSSPMRSEVRKNIPVSTGSPGPPSMGPLIRKRKEPPTLFRPSKR